MSDSIELAEKCGAVTDWLGGEPAHQDNQTFTFTRKELQAFYEAAKQQSRDEAMLAMSKMEPVAFEYEIWTECDGEFPKFKTKINKFLPHLSYLITDPSGEPSGWNKYWKNPKELIRRPQPPQTKEGSSK